MKTNPCLFSKEQSYCSKQTFAVQITDQNEKADIHSLNYSYYCLQMCGQCTGVLNRGWPLRLCQPKLFTRSSTYSWRRSAWITPHFPKRKPNRWLAFEIQAQSSRALDVRKHDRTCQHSGQETGEGRSPSFSLYGSGFSVILVVSMVLDTAVVCCCGDTLRSGHFFSPSLGGSCYWAHCENSRGSTQRQDCHPGGAKSVTMAFVQSLQRRRWPVGEEQPQTCPTGDLHRGEGGRNARTLQHLPSTFQIGLGLYIELCQQISPL